jgi:glycosyltransferase involved in cell wall biosynthesis
VLKHLEGTNVAAENLPAMEAFLRGREYDIAYCFGLLRVSFATTLPISERGIPILWHAGSSCIADHFYKWPRDVFGYRFGMNLLAGKWYRREQQCDFRHVAYVSNFLRDRARAAGFRPPGEYVISRGVDFAPRRDPERERADPPVFFMACRVDAQKGVHHTITAAGLLARRRPELAWRLEIAGTSVIPGYRAQLDEQIAREGLAERVQFIGQLPHDEVFARMRTATAFLFTSINGEPFSSTIVEALACGTPLIGSDDGSILEVVEPGESALVYRRDKPAELAAHLEAVLDDPALRRRLAAAGLVVVEERYTLERILVQTERLFAEIIAGQPAAQPAEALA